MWERLIVVWRTFFVRASKDTTARTNAETKVKGTILDLPIYELAQATAEQTHLLDGVVKGLSTLARLSRTIRVLHVGAKSIHPWNEQMRELLEKLQPSLAKGTEETLLRRYFYITLNGTINSVNVGMAAGSRRIFNAVVFWKRSAVQTGHSDDYDIVMTKAREFRELLLEVQANLLEIQTLLRT